MTLDINRETTDEEIIASYKAGNQEVFKELIERYTNPLYNFVARIGGKNDASDVVQEIFIKVWKNLGKFDQNKASFKTWLFTIGRNTVTDLLRKKRNMQFSDSLSDSFEEDIPDENLLPDESLQKLEDEKLLNSLLEKLSAPYREILVLHYQEDMTFNEIGEVLNKPLNTVKSMHRRAIIEIRKMLA